MTKVEQDLLAAMADHAHAEETLRLDERAVRQAETECKLAVGNYKEACLNRTLAIAAFDSAVLKGKP